MTTTCSCCVPAGRRFDWPSACAPRRQPDVATRRGRGEARDGLPARRNDAIGSTRAWPVIADATIPAKALVAIGGGAHGVNVHLAPADLIAATGATVADISTEEPPA